MDSTILINAALNKGDPCTRLHKRENSMVLSGRSVECIRSATSGFRLKYAWALAQMGV